LEKSIRSILFFAINFIILIEVAHARFYRCNFSEVLVHEDNNEKGDAVKNVVYRVRVGHRWNFVSERDDIDESLNDERYNFRVKKHVTEFANKNIGSNNSWSAAPEDTWERQHSRMMNYKILPGHKIKLWQEVAKCRSRSAWIRDDPDYREIRNSRIRMEDTDVRVTATNAISPSPQYGLAIQNASLHAELTRERQKHEHDLKVLELEHKHAILQKELEVKSEEGARLKDSYDKLLEALKEIHAQNLNFAQRPGERDHILSLINQALAIDTARRSMDLQKTEAERKFELHLKHINATKNVEENASGENSVTPILIVICVSLAALVTFSGTVVLLYKYRSNHSTIKTEGQHVPLRQQ
jgi:hypothetical protein